VKGDKIPDDAGGRSVLVVDDDVEVRSVLIEYLRGAGFLVYEAKNGLEALLHVKHQRPDAIVLDLSMPRLGGIEALKRIVKFDPRIQVVVITGEMDAEVHRQASRLGVRAILAKPLSLPDLTASLQPAR
jgi:CheY-like chemotaxis protein